MSWKFAAIGLVCVSAAHAELPPGSYDSLRAGAGEALVIEITSVASEVGKPGFAEVELKARVLGVERSKAGLKKGDSLTIRYTSVDPAKAKGFVGPRPTPVYEKGAVLPAFLKKSDGGHFAPAAFGMSFKMTPEKGEE